jgi:hypothetical protein
MSDLEDKLNSLLMDAQIFEQAKILSQNKAGKNIDITDVAVAKIPYVKYPDFNVEESIVIHELAEKTLKIAQSENENKEVTITYDMAQFDGDFSGIEKNMGVCFGNDKNEIDFMRDTKTYSIINRAESITVVNLHNHPDCTPFSMYDIMIFAVYEQIKLLVLVTNKGELHYLSKGENYSHMENAVFFRKTVEKYAPDALENGNIYMSRINLKQMRSISDSYLKNCYMVGITSKHVLSNDREVKNEYYRRKGR